MTKESEKGTLIFADLDKILRPQMLVNPVVFHHWVDEIIESQKGKRGPAPVRYQRIQNILRGRENSFISLSEFGNRFQTRSGAVLAIGDLNTELIDRQTGFQIVSLLFSKRGFKDETFYKLIFELPERNDQLDG